MEGARTQPDNASIGGQKPEATNQDSGILTMNYPFDVLDCVGLLRSEVWPLLEKGGIQVPAVLPAREPACPDWPDWKQVMSLLPTLTDSEAASAFAGVDLEASGYRSDDEYAEVSRWKTVLQRAILADELTAKATDFDKNGMPTEWCIVPADMVSWCHANGLAYPLPSRVSLPTTDAGLREALASCDRERAQWKAKAESMATVGDQCATLHAEIERLRGELRTKTDEQAALTVERNQLKSDALAGKSRTAALKIIGGLAMQGYRLNIHSQRLEGIGELIEDLQNVGADVTEKTLRVFLKDAANVIEPRK